MFMTDRGRNLALNAFFGMALIGMSACASDIMKNYVGQPVESVVLDYGPPTTVVELGPGERA